MKNKAVVKVMKPASSSRQRTISDLMEETLRHLGEDPAREGLVRTPDRAEKALRFLTSGYQVDIDKLVNGALFRVKHDEMVIVKDIEFYSLCEHHMLPFFGKMHVGYLPRNRVIGLSKIPRIADAFARRLQVQERLTQQVAETIQEIADPRGVGVVCEARHFCMMMRGVEKQHSGTVTSAMLGAFRRRETRTEFLSLITHSSLNF
ncbi:MAG: GTP cyclohydrolase I FolE [Acidimicrobiia bacterium]|nr:GTP cyclohydrolase I FolE [Acidimicrobiia bacterium]